MDLQTQKLNIIEEVLHLNSSELLEQVESFVKALKSQAADADEIPPMPMRSEAEIRAGLEQAFRDVENGNVLTHEEVVALTRQWRSQ